MNLLFSLVFVWTALVPLALTSPHGSLYQLSTQSLEGIATLTQNLTKAILSWDGSDLATALSDVHQPAVGLVQYLTNATGAMQAYDTIFSMNQAFRVASPSQRAAYAVNASIAALNKRVNDFNNASLTSIVMSDLKSLMNATENFSGGLIAHIPSDLGPVAENLKAQYVNSLQQGLDCFGGTDSACITAVVNPNTTYELAVKYNAMQPNGAPIS